MDAAIWGLDGPVLTYEEVIQPSFAKEDSAAVKAVVFATPEQRDTLQTLLRGTGRAHAVLIVTPDKAATQKCPGVSGGRVTYRTVAVHESYTNGLTKPQPRAMAKAVKLEQKTSTVIYVRYFQRYMVAEKWKEAHRNPQREFHAFMAQHRMKALDSWGWQVEEVPRTAQQKIFGCARVQEGDVQSLLALSGARAGYSLTSPAPTPCRLAIRSGTTRPRTRARWSTSGGC